MKLLFDENLSYRLVDLLAEDFPDSTHPEMTEMRGATDTDIWNFAASNDFIIVSKDNDFRQRAFVYGPPPKVIWLTVGNAGTASIADLLRDKITTIQHFAHHLNESLLILELPGG